MVFALRSKLSFTAINCVLGVDMFWGDDFIIRHICVFCGFLNLFRFFRKLFGSPKGIDKWLDQCMKENRSEQANKWNYDFENDKPMEPVEG